MGLSPGLVLAGLVVVILTQATRVAAGRRGPYAATLGLSVIGLLGGEVLAAGGHLAQPSIGVLHPVADVLVMVVTQAAGALAFAQTAE